MSEKTAVLDAPIDDEILKGVTPETSTLPPMDELLNDFAHTREKLASTAKVLDEKFGGTLGAVEFMQLKKQRQDAHRRLDDVNDIWEKIGGSEIEAAENEVNVSSSDNFVREKLETKLQRSRENAYENFISLYKSGETELPERIHYEVKANIPKKSESHDVVKSVDREVKKEEFDPALIESGDKVVSLSSSKDGYQNAGEVYTVHIARQNARTGKYEYLVTKADSLDGGKTKSLLITEDDIANVLKTANNKHNSIQKRTIPIKQMKNNSDSPADVDADMKKNNIDDRVSLLTQKEEGQIKRLYSDDKPRELSDDEKAKIKALYNEDDNPVELSESEKQKIRQLYAPNTKPETLSEDEEKKIRNLYGEAKSSGQENQALAVSEASDLETHAKKIESLKKEIDDTQIGRRLREKLGEYASHKADAETHGGLIGRRKRDEALRRAENALFEAQNEYALKLIYKQQSEGMYENLSDEARAQAKSDDYFNQLRSLDTDARTATRQMRETRIENRNVMQKGMAAIGKFLNGGTSKGWLRNAGPGALLGLGVGISGVGFPITAATGIGLGLSVRHASKMNHLDASLKNYEESTMDDSEFQNILAKFKLETEENLKFAGKFIADEMFRRSREKGDEDLSAARSKAASNAKKFGMGFAAGGLAGNLVGGTASAQQVSSSEDNSHNHLADGSSFADAGIRGVPDVTIDSTSDATDAFASGADRITSGEGWLNQFHDMGLTSEQSRSLFSDTKLMEKLVDQGVAYHDGSTQLGGYGINMPSNGRLSGAAMDTIRDAIEKKGF